MVVNTTIEHAMQEFTSFYIEQYIGTLPSLGQAVIIVFVGYLLGKILAFVGKKIVHLFTKNTKTELDDMIIKAVYGALSKIFFLVALYIGLLVLPLHESVFDFLGKVIFSLIYIVVIWYSFDLINSLVDLWGVFVSKKIKMKNFQEQIFPFFKKSTKIIVFIITSLLILQLWGVNIAPLLASLGVAGIVLGFALKDSLGNIFGGVSLILDNAYKVGDKVTVAGDKTGIIKEIGLRSTRIRLFDGQQLMVPNGNMATSNIVNFNQPDLQQRIVVDFGVEYGNDLEDVKKLILPLLKKMKHVSKEQKPEVLFLAMGDWDLKFSARVWVDDLDNWWSTKLAVTEIIYTTLNKSKKIHIPFPTQTIHLEK